MFRLISGADWKLGLADTNLLLDLRLKGKAVWLRGEGMRNFFIGLAVGFSIAAGWGGGGG